MSVQFGRPALAIWGVGICVFDVHWFRSPLEPYHDFEIIRGLEALLNSLSFLAPRHRTWDVLLGISRTNTTSHSCNPSLTRYGPAHNAHDHIQRLLPSRPRGHCVSK